MELQPHRPNTRNSDTRIISWLALAACIWIIGLAVASGFSQQ
jgi:hypothetical protein